MSTYLLIAQASLIAGNREAARIALRKALSAANGKPRLQRHIMRALNYARSKDRG